MRLLSRGFLVLGAALSQGAAAQTPTVVVQAPVDPALDVTFHAMLLPREIFVGQQALYQVGVFIAEDARARLRRNPEFVPPELRAMLGYDLAAPSAFARVAGARRYEVHVFQRAIFPLVAGRHAVAPARLSYSLPLSTSFFSREESKTLRSESLAVIARDPPASTERPQDYAGAVGVLTVERRADADPVAVGKPFVLTVAVRGVGNLALVPRPALRLTWAQLVNGPERVQIDSSGSLVRGVKEFDFIVTPATPGAQRIPAVRYPHFDPYAARYAIASAPELGVTVEQGTLVVATEAAGDTPLPLTIRTAYRGALAAPISTHAAYWFALALIPMPAAGVALVRRSRRRRVRQAGAALRHIAGASAGDSAHVRRALTIALSERLQMDAATLTDPRRIVRALRRRGVTREASERAAQLHAELDAAVFGGGARIADPGLASRAADVFSAIDREATHRRVPLRRATAASAMVLVLAASLAWAMQHSSTDAETFARGVALYEAGAFGSAQRVFTALAQGEPRAADAWANAGASAWQAHDTAAAAVAWQRALRLDPLDGETRQRMDVLPSFRSGLIGDVPPIPVSFIAWLGVFAWFMVCTLQPIGRHWSRVAAGSALVVAAAALVVGMRLNEIARGEQTAVVIVPERLRSAPALGADLAEEVMLGETVRTPTARTTWTLVRLNDGREGWLPTERLVSLELRD
ncbi:MAG: hypothetical protein ACT4P6_15580 [Gemmatimonadaceae bacterium]